MYLPWFHLSRAAAVPSRVYEPYHLDPHNKKHRWQCDGYATYIRM
jgi:hypothetical protein